MKQRKHAPPVVPPSVAPLRRRPVNAVPQLPERQERLIRLIAVITLAYWTYYIAWQIGRASCRERV